MEIRPEAARALDNRAADILARIRECPDSRSAENSFPTERPVTIITDEDILEEPRLFDTDVFGKHIGRYLFKNDTRYGLTGADHLSLCKLADQIIKQPGFRGLISKSWTEDIIFDWCRAQFQAGQSSAFSAFILEKTEESIREFTIWIPVAMLEVQSGFIFGPLSILPMSPQFFDELERVAPGNASQEAQVKAFFDSLRSKFQGGSAVVVTMSAEKNHAQDIALELADIATTLFRFFHRRLAHRG